MEDEFDITPKTEGEYRQMILGQLRAFTKEFRSDISDMKEILREFTNNHKHFKEKEFAVLQNEVLELKQWKAQLTGGWKFLLVIGAVVGSLITFLFSWFKK
jgi:DNA polymerase II small subunit/DNA polymerase delta subunit B